jgi:hypothetical protein
MFYSPLLPHLMMPTAEQVLAGLREITNTWRPLAVLWHVYLAAFVAFLLTGGRPPKRYACLSLVLPLLSVSILAGLSGNPFNMLVFGLVGTGLLVVSLRLPMQPVELSPAWTRISGAIFLVFGWIYPHFLDTTSPLMYLYAAPTGLIPCPTLSVVIGLTLILNGLGSRTMSLTLGITGMFYGVVGVWRLGVVIDWFLVAGSAIILLSIVLPAVSHSPPTICSR